MNYYSLKMHNLSSDILEYILNKYINNVNTAFRTASNN